MLQFSATRNVYEWTWANFIASWKKKKTLPTALYIENLECIPVITHDGDRQSDWLTGTACWRILGRLIHIYLSQLECFLCFSLNQICKSSDKWNGGRKRLSQVSHWAAGGEQRGKYFWCFGNGQLRPNVITSSLQKHRCQKEVQRRSHWHERVSEVTALPSEMKLVFAATSSSSSSAAPSPSSSSSERRNRSTSQSIPSFPTMQLIFELNANVSTLKMSTLTSAQS